MLLREGWAPTGLVGFANLARSSRWPAPLVCRAAVPVAVGVSVVAAMLAVVPASVAALVSTHDTVACTNDAAAGLTGLDATATAVSGSFAGPEPCRVGSSVAVRCFIATANTWG